MRASFSAEISYCSLFAVFSLKKVTVFYKKNLIAHNRDLGSHTIKYIFYFLSALKSKELFCSRVPDSRVCLVK